MGEARDTNVNSPQYRGPMPEHLIGSGITVRIGVDAAWLEANPPTDPPTPVPDDKQMVEFHLVAALLKPSRLVPQDQWPKYQKAMGCVLSMPLDEFKRELMGPPAEGDAAGALVLVP